MRILIILLLLPFFMPCTFASQFGQYQYSKYYAINQQMQLRRAQAIRQQQLKKAPTRNIQYPSSYNKYPNIQREYNYSLTKNQRYSSAYYNNL